MDSFFSWELLATFSGAVSLVVFIIQLIKAPIDRIGKIPTRFVVYAVSLVILTLAQHFVLGGLTLESFALVLFNSVLVALSAMSVYEQVIAVPEAEKLVRTAEIAKTITVPVTIEAMVGEASDKESETDSDEDDDGEIETF